MRKALVPFLVLGLLLLGVSPVMAAGEQVKAALPAQQDEVVQVVVPEGEPVSEQALENTSGQGLVGALIGGVLGGVGSAIEWAAGTAVGSYLAKGQVDWKAVAYAAAAGFVGGFVRGAIKGAIVGP